MYCDQIGNLWRTKDLEKRLFLSLAHVKPYWCIAPPGESEGPNEKKRKEKNHKFIPLFVQYSLEEASAALNSAE